MTKQEGKTEKTRICKTEGCNKPPLTWKKDPNRVVSGYCKECHAEKAGRKKSELISTGIFLGPPRRSECPTLQSIAIDDIPFHDYPGVVEALEEAAHVHLRPMNLQALAYIVEGLKRDSCIPKDELTT